MVGVGGAVMAARLNTELEKSEDSVSQHVWSRGCGGNMTKECRWLGRSGGAGVGSVVRPDADKETGSCAGDLQSE